MKRNINDVFDEATANEVDKLVNSNDVGEISSQELESIKERVYYKTGIQKPQKRKSFIFRWQGFATIAACLLLVFSMVFVFDNRASGASFTIDVNPSIEFLIDKEENVKKVTALNGDASAIIDGLELEGMPLKDALTKVVNAMVQKNYISTTSNSVLVSVDGDDEDCIALRDKLALMVKDALVSDEIEIAVVSHNHTANKSLSALAKEFDISIGKAAIISKIIELDGRHVFEELVDISINDLNILLEKCDQTAISVNKQGDASKKSYINGDDALKIALDDFGVTLDAVTDVEVEIDYYHNTIVYEVEFELDGIEYEYTINATDSTIIKVDIDDDNDDDDVAPSDVISSTDAFDIAVLDAGVNRNDLFDISVDLDKDDGKYYYEVEFKTNNAEYEYDIDAKTGNIADKEIDYKNVGGGNLTQDRITSSTAIEKALADAGLTREEIFDLSVEFDYDDGVAYYEVEFNASSKEYEYKINALDGSVIDKEIELD